MSRTQENGTPRKLGSQELNRADEVDDLVDAVKALIVPFVREADEAASLKASGNSTVLTAQGVEKNVLIEQHDPESLLKLFNFELPDEGKGKGGLLDVVEKVLKYSVNTWDQGFLDKLYATNNAVGLVADMVLSALNTNLHVYQVSPALTLVEKLTARRLANMFGFTSPYAGGIVCQGGSSSNFTSLVVARNTLFPETKTLGNGTHQFALFTSSHGHYSVEKSAVGCGMGSSCVVSIPVDPSSGQMLPDLLRNAIIDSKSRGKTPLYVNATAGTTVMGSYDPFIAVSDICREFGLWMHVDGSWGGPALFSRKHKWKVEGVQKANSITINPHKMLNVPITCSFLLTEDLRVLHAANSLPAGYLFHGGGGEDEKEEGVWDLADLTLQCGRRGDALKLALAWTYYGFHGFEAQIDNAFSQAEYLADLIDRHPSFTLVSPNPPPCLQVCFYYTPKGKNVLGETAENTATTKMMAEALIKRGFMVDYAPGEKGSFFRVVVNCQTLRGTVEGLVKALEAVGQEVARF